MRTRTITKRGLANGGIREPSRRGKRERTKIQREVREEPQAGIEDPEPISSTPEMTQLSFIRLRRDVLALRLVILTIMRRLREARIIDDY